MLKAIEKTKATNSERNGYAHGLSNSTYELAKQLDEIATGQYCEMGLGVSFRSWVENLRDEFGRPRNYSWAKGLRRQLKKIRHHPVLVRILDRQKPLDAAGFITFSSAFFTAKLAEEENWTNKTVMQMRADAIKKEYWEEEKNARLGKLYYTWGTKTSRQIMDRLAEIRADREDEETPKAWPHHGGRVDPDVKKRYDEALDRLAKLTEAGDPGEFTYTREVECLGEGVNDLLDAVEAAADGDTNQLRAWLDQIAGEK